MRQVGTIVWLSSELMFFAALFAMYFTIRSVVQGLGLDRPTAQRRPSPRGNTIVLVISSVTCQLGVFAAERGQVGRTGKLWQFGQWGMREWYVAHLHHGRGTSSPGRSTSTSA